MKPWFLLLIRIAIVTESKDLQYNRRDKRGLEIPLQERTSYERAYRELENRRFYVEVAEEVKDTLILGAKYFTIELSATDDDHLFDFLLRKISLHPFVTCKERDIEFNSDILRVPVDIHLTNSIVQGLDDNLIEIEEIKIPIFSIIACTHTQTIKKIRLVYVEDPTTRTGVILRRTYLPRIINNQYMMLKYYTNYSFIDYETGEISDVERSTNPDGKDEYLPSPRVVFSIEDQIIKEINEDTPIMELQNTKEGILAFTTYKQIVRARDSTNRSIIPLMYNHFHVSCGLTGIHIDKDTVMCDGGLVNPKIVQIVDPSEWKTLEESGEVYIQPPVQQSAETVASQISEEKPNEEQNSKENPTEMSQWKINLIIILCIGIVPLAFYVGCKHKWLPDCKECLNDLECLKKTDEDPNVDKSGNTDPTKDTSIELTPVSATATTEPEADVIQVQGETTPETRASVEAEPETETEPGPAQVQKTDSEKSKNFEVSKVDE